MGKEKFYLSNGKAEADYGFVLKGIDETDDKIIVVDELDRVGHFEVSKSGIVEIEKKEYDHILNMNKDINEGKATTEEILEAIKNLLKKYEN